MARRILRPMEYGDLLDEMFDLYKKHFVLFVGIFGVIYLPIQMIIYLVMTYSLHPLGKLLGTPGHPPANPSASLPTLFAALGFMALISFAVMPLQLLAQGAVTWAVSRCYLEKSPTIGESYKAVLPKLWRYVVTAFITSIMVTVGTMFCCAPGIVLMIFLAFVSEVIILEDTAYFDAITRSFRLVALDFWRVVVLGLLTGLLYSAIYSIILIPFFFVRSLMPEKPFTVNGIGITQTLVESIANSVVIPVLVITFVLLYYDIRVRREGFDLEMLASGIGESVNQSTQQETATNEAESTKDSNNP